MANLGKAPSGNWLRKIFGSLRWKGPGANITARGCYASMALTRRSMFAQRRCIFWVRCSNMNSPAVTGYRCRQIHHLHSIFSWTFAYQKDLKRNSLLDYVLSWCLLHDTYLLQHYLQQQRFLGLPLLSMERKRCSIKYYIQLKNAFHSVLRKMVLVHCCATPFLIQAFHGTLLGLPLLVSEMHFLRLRMATIKGC